MSMQLYPWKVSRYPARDEYKVRFRDAVV